MLKEKMYEKFKNDAQKGYNLVPITKKYIGDLETPLSTYLKLVNGPNSYLLESVVGGERFGRFSFIGLPAKLRLEVIGEKISLFKNGELIKQVKEDPLSFIENYISKFRPSPITNELPRFCGGLAGYFGYDTVKYIEPKLKEKKTKNKDPQIPDILLLQTDELAVFDNYTGNITLICYANPNDSGSFDNAYKRLYEMEKSLSRPLEISKKENFVKGDVRRRFSKEDYKNSVLRAQEHIYSGDVMQVVLGQVLEKPFSGEALSLYRSLRSINPSPYMYFYDLGDFQVIGASPEILVRQDNAISLGNKSNRITIRPIAGTRPRGKTEREDRQLEEELKKDPKEIAEHVMLIDLARNDIGRIAEVGSVFLTEKMIIEKYSHVMHLVSEVEGTLRKGLSFMDVLKATFPAGTLSGAPKIRAMEIIDDLEPEGRGLYGGACGYISFSGEMDLAIAIRTGVLKDGILSVQAGAGIVFDSLPENEWRESEAKALAILKAVEFLENDF